MYFKQTCLALVFGVSTAAMALPSPVGQDCVTMSGHLNAAHSLSSSSLEPFAHMLPANLDANAIDMSAYQLDLKPLQLNDITRLQFYTRDNLGVGAGYTSPYLWEAGRGPGPRMNSGPWSPGMMPAPYPGRR